MATSAVEVLRLVVHVRTREPVLLLGETDGNRYVPVFLRRPQADVIALGRRGSEDPLPQDVLVPVLRGLGHRIEAADIVGLEDGVFRAELVVDGGTRVPLRTGNALALAVREGLPIGVADTILDEVGRPISDLFRDGPDERPEQQLAAFRSFLDEVDPDGFQRL